MKFFESGFIAGILVGSIGSAIYLTDRLNQNVIGDSIKAGKDIKYLKDDGTELIEDTVKSTTLDIHSFLRNIKPNLNRLNRKKTQLTENLTQISAEFGQDM